MSSEAKAHGVEERPKSSNDVFNLRPTSMMKWLSGVLAIRSGRDQSREAGPTTPRTTGKSLLKRANDRLHKRNQSSVTLYAPRIHRAPTITCPGSFLDDFEKSVMACNDPSLVDSTVGIPRKANMLDSRYVGKGKGRATERLCSRSDSIVFASRAQGFERSEVPIDDLPTVREMRLYLEESMASCRKNLKEAGMPRAGRDEWLKLSREIEDTLENLEGIERMQRVGVDPAQLRDCNVCGDQKLCLDFPARSPSVACEHKPTTCLDCLASWMASEVEIKGSQGIKCPECPSILEHADVQRAAIRRTFESYEKTLTRNALTAMACFAWCLNPACKSGQENPENTHYMHCAACGYKQCLRHKCPWHSNETCEQYAYRTSGSKAKDEEAKTEAMLDGMSKKCPGPGCGWRIEKTGGCEHMKCNRCRYEFCWLCLASHARIKKEGNAVHESWCKLHSANLKVA